MIIAALRRMFRHNTDRHLDDKLLIRLFSRKLWLPARWASHRHLAACAFCRQRQRELEGPRADRMMALYRKYAPGAEMALPEETWQTFARWLSLQMRRSAAHSASPKASAGVFDLRALAPAAKYAVGLALIAGLCAIPLSRMLRKPEVAANDLLERAARMELASASIGPGVARQTVLIEAGGESVRRSIYWDVEQHRKAKAVALPAAEEQFRGNLRDRLDAAGVDWDRPLSVASYRRWHDLRHAGADRVARRGEHLLILSSTAAEGEIAEESLTLRDSDLHPVERRIDFRDRETVEIAEVEFNVLPWSAADENLFEPLTGMTQSRALVPTPRFEGKQQPSVEQLDETELAARFELNRLHADQGEQIEIHRLGQFIEVDGVVDTEERKQELMTQLSMVPNVHASILSDAESQNKQPVVAGSLHVEDTSFPDTPSALAGYELARGRGTGEINTLEQRLFDGALTVSHEANAIDDLNSHFHRDAQMSPIASATLSSLLYSHHQQLEAALHDERVLLRELVGGDALLGATGGGGKSLLEEADRNLALIRELTQAKVPAARTAEAILADLSSEPGRIAVAAASSYKPLHNEQNQLTSTNDR